MKRLILLLFLSTPLIAQVRREIAIPDLPNHRTLVCDFHMHTVFSDGTVWPTVRIDEAWRTGLDAIAISDHVEYQPHADDLPTNHNRPFALCRQRAKEHGLTLLRAAEITRSTPPGHFNAIFLKDIDKLDTENFTDAIREANRQGGFVFWNHHDWKGEEKGAWMDIHQQLFDEGLLHGMEVANGEYYYPRAHQWCLERNLTMFGNSDIHPPELRTESRADDHRTSTLVFARDASPESIQEALVARRTAVWFKNQVIGRGEQLDPLFRACVSVDPPHLREGGSIWVRLRNRSIFDFQLSRTAGPGPRELQLPAESVVLLRLRVPQDGPAPKFEYQVENFLVGPGEPLTVSYQPSGAPGN